MKTFEYKSVEVEKLTISELNKHGQEGWEFASEVIRTKDSNTVPYKIAIAIFKRATRAEPTGIEELYDMVLETREYCITDGRDMHTALRNIRKKTKAIIKSLGV